MPSWEIHDKWAHKMEISEEISNYINRAIDNIDVPEDLIKYVNEVKIPRPRGRVPFFIAELLAMFGKHDFGHKKFIKEEVLPFFQRKGTDYVKAYYLHFILDYIGSPQLKDWMKNTGESIEDSIDKYQKNKAITVLGTEKQLIEVMDFLKRNAQELQKDLNLKSPD